MSNENTPQGYLSAHALRPDLLGADDEKLRRILAMVDGLADPAVNQALLDPLRSRLATLKPARSPRFARLLFIPVEPLTVPLADWRDGDPAIPRPALALISGLARDASGGLADQVNAIIAREKDDPTRAIDHAGAVAWPRFAAILAAAPIPHDWAHSGLPPAAFPAIAAGIAAVLRNAVPLRRLARDEEIGAAPDTEAVNAVLHGLAAESPAARALVARLLLVRAPRAFPLLWRGVLAGGEHAARSLFRAAIECAKAATLTALERDTAFAEMIGRGALPDVGRDARRIEAVLREIESDPAGARHQTRVAAIRANLDIACRDRISRGVGEELMPRLAAASPSAEASGPADLESCARDLRRLDASAGAANSASDPGERLRRAIDAVRAAADAGALSPMKSCRLIEILSGPDAAEALYQRLCGDT